MKDADLYLDEIDLRRYLTRDECRKCGADSCKELIEELERRGCAACDLRGVPPDKARALQAVIDVERILPRAPLSPNPRPGTPGLTKLNNPACGDPILITGNNVFTQEVLMAVLSSTRKPFFFLSSDTQGDSLDMAVILGSFTADTVKKSLDTAGLPESASASPLLIPGRAIELAESIRSATGRHVEVGPVCAAELPLFYAETW